MPASPSHAVVSQFDATQCHPEFGYLAPTMRFRRKIALTLKAAVFGALAGAAAMFALGTDREDKAVVMLATPVAAPPAAAAPANRAPAVNIFAPVRFVPESFALPPAASASPGIRAVASPLAGSKAAAPLDLAAIAAAPIPTAEARAVAPPKKKAAQPERTARMPPPEPAPRTAYADAPRWLAEPAGLIRSIFGFAR